MEERVMDELYGDLGQRHYDSSLNHDEDSVDIYSGLDDSPKCDGGNREVSTFLSPQRVKESMDLYEELITEEREEKDATYNELKSKFDAAQNQVQELLAKLQQMQTKNSSLHKENTLLKKNISALIKTARMEIIRKDEEINKLSNRPGRGRFHQSWIERSQEPCLRNQANTGPNVNSPAGPSKESQECRGGRGLAEASEHRDRSRLSSHPVHPVTSTDASPSSVLQRCTRSNHDRPLYCQSKDSMAGEITNVSSPVAKKGEMYAESEIMNSQNCITAGQNVCDETAGTRMDSKEVGKEYLTKQCNKQSMESNPKEKNSSEKTPCDVNKSERPQRESEKMNCASSKSQRQQQEDPVVLRRSGRAKSPFSQPQHVSPSKSHSQLSKGPSRVTSDTQTESRKQEQDRRSRSGAHSVSEISSSEKSSVSLDRKMEKRGSREHHRKEERRHEDSSSSERRRTRNDRSKEYEQKKTRESEGGNGQQGNSSSREERRSTRSETSKEHERRNAKEIEEGIARGAADKADRRFRDGRDRSHNDVRNSRRESSPVKHGDQDSGRTLRKDRDEDINRRKISSKREEQLPRNKASSSLDDSRNKASDKHSVKEKCVDIDYDKGRRRTDKDRQTLDRKSTKEIPAADIAKSAIPEKSRIGENGHVGETVYCQNEKVNMRAPLKLSSHDISAMAEESSPKRKLSFMETLNLTLSPIKKQSQSSGHEEPIMQPPEDAHVSNSAEERGSFELGEEFCVIDETENSQVSVEAMDVESASATGSSVPLDPSNSGTQPSQSQDIIPGSGKPKTDLQDLVVKEKGLEFSKSVGEATCKGVTTPVEEICIDLETQEKTSVINTDHSGDSPEKCTDSSQCAVDKTVMAEGSLPSEGSVPVNSLSVHSVEDVCKKQDPQASVRKHEEDRSRENASKECKPKPQAPLTVQIDASQEKVSTSIKVHAVPEACSNADTSVSLEVVSSTVSVDVNPQCEHGCADTQTTALDVEMIGGLQNLDSCPRPSEGGLAGAVNTSSTLRGKGTPTEQASSSQPDSTEDELPNSRPFNSVVVTQDEDSMMLTLSNIRVIPEAISPLTSPVRQMRKVQHSLGKEAHVKSLSKDLSASASETDKDTIKMDMNKENKRPDLSVMPTVVKDPQEVLSSTVEEEELEEGEIDSRSDEESSLIIQSPPHEKTKSVSRNQPSPRSPRLEKRTSQMRPTVTPTREQDRNLTAASKDSPTFNKRRFKIIAVPPKAKVTTSAEFMNMLLFIRSELRRKYMKLHKNVTKSAFCCIVDMSLASFTEFVDGVNFHKFCSQGNEIKSRLNKIISSVMSKVSSNGIVNRIFEQRADDLKQKLWNFVDGQFDFLFKELKAAVKSASGLSKNTSFESKCLNSRVKESLNLDIHKVLAKKPLSTAEHRPNKKDEAGGHESKQWTTLHSLPGKIRGLGSRGKNIKATMEGETQVSERQSSDQLPAVSTSEKSSQESVPAPENKISTYARRVSQDRTDFEILTEQQTSSLTFNLVTDSQMGDIFRCLLQGSDLLEASVSAGENQSWPLNTPRKEGPAGESFIGVVTPSKIITPSNLTWTSISPYKFASPNNKIQIPLNPEVFDESCLLEVPSNTLPNQAASGLTTVSSQQPFSILAEDLAVSLTIPSPLKSDGHLSFLHPASGQPLSAPSSVISAHYSEDALLDGEDATEQDIHLSLDTDNSSCGSSSGQTCDEDSHPPVFQFKPNLPMQAEVMERSNDHFIVRIRHTSTAASEEPTQEQKEAQSAVETSAVCHEDKTLVSQASLDNGSRSTIQQVVTVSDRTEAQMSIKDTSSKGVLEGNTPAVSPKTTGDPADQADGDAADASHPHVATGASVAFKEKDDAPDTNSTCEKTHRKRKKRHSGPKAKRSRTEKHQDRHEKQRHKKRSKSCKEKDEKTPPKKGDKSPQESPGLSAKNVIRKKGEVVVTWTRDEDRDILIELKMKGASSKTFIALSAKLKKSPAQIEERFTQLMKLLKKKEKMEN
ncbi:LOW QUALITY PROTEIN: CASP8-associated protein 2 [Colossoma macropomum]|uniref:LOW QUALITY PROTEIN: CASP8-associated protein 2 n=1 Tax=Colossoma macropomum TaxID=42526 RepID=UPI001864CB7F|nr:LOW QUALITY PROTEIN: CASP8-associated protein 2 [Colossoma macropomum]